MKRKTASSRRALALTVLAFACGTAMYGAPSFAQDQNQTQTKKPDEAKDLQAITVTGSRISDPNIVSATPVAVISAEDIKATGAVNIGDLLTTMPQLSTTFTMGNSGRFIGTAGVAAQDLRNLGPDRTLVLVNGRRFVGSSAGTTEVDVNQIPVDFIERVEVITGGASAVYGADAVAGVVNFILKKQYTGANLHIQEGTSEHGNFNKRLISLSGGMNFDNDRGNVAISVEHSSQDALEFPDRFGNESYSSVNTPNGPTDKALLPNAGNYLITNGGSFSTGSSIVDRPNLYVFDPDGSVRHQRFGGIADNAGHCQDCDHADISGVNQLQPRYGRTTVSAMAHFDITTRHRLYAEGNYTHVNVKTMSQPAFGLGGSAYGIAPDNAYITAPLAAITGGDAFYVGRFDTDAGRRGEDTKRNTSRLVLGASGLITDDWEYDAHVNYGITKEHRLNLNNRINNRFFASIDAVRDPATGQIVCRSVLDPNSVNLNTGTALSPADTQGCVPTSIFGNGAVSQAAARYFNTTTFTNSRLTEFVGGGTVTNNNLFDMPGGAGAASVVGGVELRRETSQQNTDPLDVTGQTFLNAIPSAGGSYDVKEGFVEFGAPVLTDRFLAKNVSFDTAVRFSDYSTIGHTKTWRYGLNWAIDDNIRLRGTNSYAVRAPNVGELFGGQSQNFAFINDPCQQIEIPNGKDPTVRARNCAALGVAPNFTSSNSATIEGLSGSNPNLQSEVGRTWTAGMVLTPQFVPGFGISFDYFNIKLTNAIASVSPQDAANRCVDAPSGVDNVFCSNISRDATTHEISFFRTLNQNLAGESTSGVDIEAYYRHALGAGKFNLKLNATKVIAFTERPFQDDPNSTIQDNGTLGFPKWKSSLLLSYSVNNWLFDLNTRYFSRMLRVTNESFQSNPTSTTPIRASSAIYNDVKASYVFGDSGLQGYLGITNVADRKPAVGLYGTGFGSALYDALGRSYYAGVNFNF